MSLERGHTNLDDKTRQRRTEALMLLIALSEDLNPQMEIQRLKQEDEGF
ncbi:MAG: hypothetical protein KC800_02300 [Candidatus Eremiobacteraeota bacterium]|nr:hypothetical protein [Candidatus Eremiobacteraeota bacterium]